MLLKVISGGQDGADIAALRAARSCGIKTGGLCPAGWRTLHGHDPSLAQFGIEESDSPNYPPRTYANVKNSDGTLRLAKNFESAGERCTLKAIDRYNKPMADVQIYEDNTIRADPLDVVKWIIDEEVEVLNVAGNGLVEIEKPVQDFLERVFSTLKEAQC